MKAYRAPIYAAVNLGFGLFTVAACVMQPSSGVHPLYLIVLWMLCTTPILDMTELNGPYALLAVFSLNFLLFYGLLDMARMVSGQAFGNPADGVLSAPEGVILLGCALTQIAYRVACRKRPAGAAALSQDWSELSLIAVGLLLWTVCTALNWDFSVHIIAEASARATQRGLGTLSGLQTTAYMLAHMAQPLGILIIAYAQCRYRRAYMAPLLIVIVVFQLLFGFVIDFKGEAFLGGVLAILTKVLVDGRLPKVWLAAMVVFIAVGFPVLQANRVVVRGQYGANSTTVGENIGKSLKRAFEARDMVSTGRDRSQTFAERLSLKASVETIVMNTGEMTPFQHGYTLTPLVSAFIPRLLWPDKPSIEVGRMMNKDFKVSDVADTYISPSHLGELFWNFGWLGVLVGMTLIGALLGFIGARFDLAQAATITRIMVVVVTIRLMILGSEGEIATQYVLWIRSMAIIGLLHWVFARVPASLGERSRVAQTPTTGNSTQDPVPVAFPNLLR